MKLALTIIGLILAALPGIAQNPQSSTAPLYAVNAKYTNGVAPGYMPCGSAALNCPSTTGLNLLLGPGTVNCGGTVTAYAGGTLSLTASVTNYVYLNTAASCAPAVKTSAFTSSDIPIAVVVAGSSTITSITDDRTIFNLPGSGASSISVAYNLNTGAPASPASVILAAPASGTIHGCTFVTTSSDGSTALTFNLTLAGTSIFSGASQTIAAGTTQGTSSTLTLATSTISVTAGQQWLLSISSGTSNWTGSLSCN